MAKTKTQKISEKLSARQLLARQEGDRASRTNSRDSNGRESGSRNSGSVKPSRDEGGGLDKVNFSSSGTPEVLDMKRGPSRNDRTVAKGTRDGNPAEKHATRKVSSANGQDRTHGVKGSSEGVVPDGGEDPEDGEVESSDEESLDSTEDGEVVEELEEPEDPGDASARIERFGLGFTEGEDRDELEPSEDDSSATRSEHDDVVSSQVDGSESESGSGIGLEDLGALMNDDQHSAKEAEALAVAMTEAAEKAERKKARKARRKEREATITAATLEATRVKVAAQAEQDKAWAAIAKEYRDDAIKRAKAYAKEQQRDPDSWGGSSGSESEDSSVAGSVSTTASDKAVMYGKSNLSRISPLEKQRARLSKRQDAKDVKDLESLLSSSLFSEWRVARARLIRALHRCLVKLKALPKDVKPTGEQRVERNDAVYWRAKYLDQLQELFDKYLATALSNRSLKKRKAIEEDLSEDESKAQDAPKHWDDDEKRKQKRDFMAGSSANEGLWQAGTTFEWKAVIRHIEKWQNLHARFPACLYNSRFSDSQKEWILLVAKNRAYEGDAQQLKTLKKLLYQGSDFSKEANRRLIDILTIDVFPSPDRAASGSTNLLHSAVGQLGTAARPWKLDWYTAKGVEQSLAPFCRMRDVEFQAEWAQNAKETVAEKKDNARGVANLYKVIKENDVGLNKKSVDTIIEYMKRTSPAPASVPAAFEKLSSWLLAQQKSVQDMISMGCQVVPVGEESSHNKGGGPKAGGGAGGSKEKPKAKQPAEPSKGREPSKGQEVREACHGCGYTNHTWDQCDLKKHPNWNTDKKTPWRLSAAGKHWATRPYNNGKPGIPSLSRDYLFDGSPWPEAPGRKSAPGDKKPSMDMKRQRSGGESDRKSDGGKKQYKGEYPALYRLCSVTRETVEGPTTPCLLLHPTLPYSKPIHPFLDSMSRETVMSETLAHHLAVEGLVGKPPPELAKEKVEFELADGSIVKPVDRATIILFSNLSKRSYELHPFVIESAQEWLLVGGVDIVAMNWTGVLQDSLKESYSSVVSNILECFPPQHSGIVNRDTDVFRGKGKTRVEGIVEQGTIWAQGGSIQGDTPAPGGNKRRRDGNLLTTQLLSPSDLVVNQASMVLTNQKWGVSKPDGDQPVLHESVSNDARVGVPLMAPARLDSSQTTSTSASRKATKSKRGTVRWASKTDESECVIEHRRAPPDRPPIASGGIAVESANQLCFTIFSSSMEQPEGTIAHMSDFFGPVDDTGDPEEYDREIFDDLEFTTSSVSPTSLVTINRDNLEEAKQVEELIEEFSDVFAVEVRPQPALVAPIELKVDIEQWKRIGGKGPPRRVSADKQRATVALVSDMERLCVIRKSQTVPYSQLHLVDKPSSDKPTTAQPLSNQRVSEANREESKVEKVYRPTVDFKILNTTMESMSWPLPRIKDVFVRIGEKKPKYFAVMDLTSGYHQIPVAVDSIPLTAFICCVGVYEWLRLPMGIKPAGSFFQMTMQIIFGALLFRIIEIYLDDLIVHAPTFAAYMSNLREVFEAAKAKRLTFNPKKCKFLFKEVKALGLTLDEKGIRMCEDKIKKALNFPTPVQTKHLKSFVGLANYFRDFIPLFTQVVTPFNRMLRDYKTNRHKKLPWTDELVVQYKELQQALSDCQQLYFIDDLSPIYLMTDASDYGYGAYLCQIVEGKEYPIAFNSKSFNEVQGRWSTVEQECFAIFSALMEWRCLLEGRKFTIRTDHANLRYMQESPSDKVNRWKLAYQHFDANIEHFKGTFNRIADGFSRLVQDVRIERGGGPERSMPVAHLCMCLAIESPSIRRSNLKSIISRSLGEIPPERRELIAAVHNPVVGHLGIKRTRAALAAQKHSWTGMNTHIRQFIRECPYCQKTSTKLPAVETAPYTVSSRQPMTVRAIDTLGPFPADDEGYTHVVSIIDMFSRFLCLYPVKDTTAVTCVENALLPHFGLFGTPLYLISDNGKEFVADVVKQFHELVGTIQVPITPYSHEENSLVERSHGETLKHVRALVFDRTHHKEWRKTLPLVQRIINAQDLPAIGCTPNDLLFGKAIDTNQGIFLEFTKKEQDQMQVGEYLQKIYREQARLIKKAQELLYKHQLDHQRKAGAVTEFPVNSYVLVQYPPGPGRRSQPPTKLHTHLKGPLKVVKHEGTAYWLQDIVTGKNRRNPLHVSRLVAFRYNPTHTSPKDVARRDLQEFFVDEILQHRYTTQRERKNKGEMEFLVSWTGMTPEWNTWEPWQELRATKALHRYLARVGLASLIPTEFRRNNYEVVSSDSEEEDVLGDPH